LDHLTLVAGARAFRRSRLRSLLMTSALHTPHAARPACANSHWNCLKRANDHPWLLALFVLALGVSVRAGELDAMVNVDMYLLWSRRILRFMHALDNGELQHTRQSHHPGVTFMWLAGLLWQHFGVVDAPLDPSKVRLAVMPVVTIGSLFPVASFGLMLRLLGRGRTWIALMVAVLFATEPLLVAHSRNAHLDVMVTSFSWVAVLAALIAKRERSLRWAAGSGALLGLALLTKLSAAGYALGIALVFVAALVLEPSRRGRLMASLALIVVVSASVIFACWPALWVSPLEVVERLHKGLKLEVDKTGAFMFLGETGKLDLPFWIYGVFLVYLVTPEFFLPGIGLLATWRTLESRSKAFIFDAFTASLPLVVLVLKSNHVGNRYLIPILPLFGTLAGVALARFVTWLREETHTQGVRCAAETVLPLLILFRVARLVALYPLPITYCSSWPGVDCSERFHTGWGEGMKQAAQFAARTSEERAYNEKLTIYGGAYATIMAVWTPLKTTKDLAEAHLLVLYLPDRQRKLPTARAIEDYTRSNQVSPLHEVKIAGRTYVTVYPWPRY
jgi:4-amino-4-deoxy-L-arabinose transferase-like glycosyltransferase